ncbi:Hypothetical protein, putative [Bodo saltans]|uniref:Uncharacterized protein n=1 Tax=Bodo saltans TaxID=75058 RepID=A0A0S4JLA5_BODSA|nr:Hypothetical protein, putative [Bodo saltans]|eukprot:CUG92272.1 Hypothetical protein, putative [Bodo saltans]
MPRRACPPHHLDHQLLYPSIRANEVQCVCLALPGSPQHAHQREARFVNGLTEPSHHLLYSGDQPLLDSSLVVPLDSRREPKHHSRRCIRAQRQGVERVFHARKVWFWRSHSALSIRLLIVLKFARTFRQSEKLPRFCYISPVHASSSQCFRVNDWENPLSNRPLHQHIPSMLREGLNE